jgi:hypothetical protein
MTLSLVFENVKIEGFFSRRALKTKVEQNSCNLSKTALMFLISIEKYWEDFTKTLVS